MIHRRKLVGSGLIAGAGAMLPVVPDAAAAQRDNTSGNEAVARAIDELRAGLERRFEVSPELSRIREQQRVFLKANQKFPDFVEIGIDVWENVYDWHVRHQQPMAVSRTTDGRYVMTVMFTTLILRPEQTGGYVGFGFDAR
jgi:hypothetical protein